MATPWGSLKKIDATELASIQSDIASKTYKAWSAQLNVTKYRNASYGSHGGYTSTVTGSAETFIYNGGNYTFTVTNTKVLKCIFLNGGDIADPYQIYMNCGSDIRHLNKIVTPKATESGLVYIIDIDDLDPERMYSFIIIRHNGQYGSYSAFDTIITDPSGLVFPGQAFTLIYQYDNKVPKKCFGYEKLETSEGWDRKFGRFLNLLTYYTGWDSYLIDTIDYSGVISARISNAKSVSKSICTFDRLKGSFKFTVKGTSRIILLGYATLLASHSINSKIYIDGIPYSEMQFKGAMTADKNDANVTSYPELSIIDDIILNDKNEHTIEIVKEDGYYANIDAILLEKGGTILKHIPSVKVSMIDSFILHKDEIFYTKRAVQKIPYTDVDGKYKYTINKNDISNGSIKYIGLQNINILTDTKTAKYRDDSNIVKTELNDISNRAAIQTYTSTTLTALDKFIPAATATEYLKTLAAIPLTAFDATANNPDNIARAAMRPGEFNIYISEYQPNRDYTRYAFKTTSSFISLWANLNVNNKVGYFIPYHPLWSAGTVQILVYINGKLKASSDCIYYADTTKVASQYAEVIRLDGIEPDDVIEVFTFDSYNGGIFAGIGYDKNTTYSTYWDRSKVYMLDDYSSIDDAIATVELTDIPASLVDSYIKDIFTRDTSLTSIDIYSPVAIDDIYIQGNTTGIYPVDSIPVRDVALANGFGINDIESLIQSGYNIADYSLYNIQEMGLDRYAIYGTNDTKYYNINNRNIQTDRDTYKLASVPRLNGVTYKFPDSFTIVDGYVIGEYNTPIDQCIGVKEV